MIQCPQTRAGCCVGPGPGATAAAVLWTQGSWWPVSEWGLSEAVTDKTPSRDQKANNKHRVI